MRRLFAALFAVLLAMPLGLASVAAQGATPVSTLSAYPEVDVTLTDSEVQVGSDQIPAGYIRLVVTNNSQAENGVGLLAIPEGASMDALSQATPEAGNFIPPFFYTSTIAGGPTSIQPGETASQVVYVDAGQWVVFPMNDQQPMQVTVAETADSVMDAPVADATITESDFAFTGFEQLSVGQQVLAVTNEGQQPHMFDFFKVPDGTTMADIEELLSLPDNATPAPGMLQESDIVLVPDGQVLLQSSGTTAYMDVNLEAGTYVAICFVIDPATGMPHAMEGMVSLFQVGGAGTEAATPVS